MKAIRLWRILACSWAAAVGLAQSTPPEAVLTVAPRGGLDGSRAKPFQDSSGFRVTLAIEDGTPSSYIVNWLAPSLAGDFCGGPRASWVGVERDHPTLLHPRVRSGVARITVTARIQEVGSTALDFARTVWTAGDSRGCTGGTVAAPVGVPPRGISLSADRRETAPGGTVRLTARAESAEPLTFIFYASSAADPEVRGEPLGSRRAIDCGSGCEVSIDHPVGPAERTFWVHFESDDGDVSVAGPKIPITVRGGCSAAVADLRRELERLVARLRALEPR